MRFVIWILVALVMLLLTGVLPAGESRADAVFRSPVFIALLAMLAVSSAAGCIAILRAGIKRRSFGLKGLGLLLSHVSVVIIMAGACLRYLHGMKGTFLLPVLAGHSINSTYDGSISLDFGISAADLEISYYEPTHYDLFIPTSGNDMEAGAHEFARKVLIPEEGPMVVDEETKVEISDLKDEEGEWVPFRHLPDGSILQANRTVSRYSAMMHFNGEAGDEFCQEIAVNHPVQFRDWRFYLMSVREGHSYIVLSGKKDPGWPLVRAGIWMMMAGVAITCFRKSSRN